MINNNIIKSRYKIVLQVWKRQSWLKRKNYKSESNLMLEIRKLT